MKEIRTIEICSENPQSLNFPNCTKELIKHNKSISTMESCTGGLVASCITDIEGASNIIKGAFVTYSNIAKVQQGVPQETIDTYGVYSYETAREMAFACKRAYQSDIGIGVTGTTGNVDENNKDSQVGVIYYCIIYNDIIENHKLEITSDIVTSRGYAKRVIVSYILNSLDKILVNM